MTPPKNHAHIQPTFDSIERIKARIIHVGERWVIWYFEYIVKKINYTTPKY